MKKSLRSRIKKYRWEKETERIRKLEYQPMRSNIQLQEFLAVKEKKIKGRKLSKD